MSEECSVLCIEVIIMPWENNDNSNTPDSFGSSKSYGDTTCGADFNGDRGLYM